MLNVLFVMFVDVMTYTLLVVAAAVFWCAWEALGREDTDFR